MNQSGEEIPVVGRVTVKVQQLEQEEQLFLVVVKLAWLGLVIQGKASRRPSAVPRSRTDYKMS